MALLHRSERLRLTRIAPEHLEDLVQLDSDSQVVRFVAQRPASSAS